MKFTILRDALREATRVAAGSVAKRMTIPVLANVLIEARADGVTLVATDIDSTAKVRADADVEAGGSVTVPGALLAEIAAKLPVGMVTLEEVGKGVALSAGRSRFVLPTMPADEFPIVDFDYDEWALPLSAGQFTAFADIAFAAATNEFEGSLRGVHIYSKAGSLFAAATDKHVAVRVNLGTGDDIGPEGLTIPADIVQKAGRLFAGSAVTIRRNERSVGIFGDAVEFHAATFERPYPSGPLDQMLAATDATCTLRCDRRALISAIERVCLANREISDRLTIFELNGTLKVSGGMNTRAVDEVVDVEHEGDGMKIGFNGPLVLSALGHFEEDVIEWKWSGVRSRSLLRGVGNDTVDGLLMPLNILKADLPNDS